MFFPTLQLTFLSQGGVDAAAAYSMFWPKLKDKVVGLVLVQSPYGGNPIAPDILCEVQIADVETCLMIEVLICKIIKVCRRWFLFAACLSRLGGRDARWWECINGRSRMVTDDAGEISIADERSVPSRDGSSSGAKMTTTYNSYEEARKRRVAELQARLQEIGSLQAAEELRSLASKNCQHKKLIEVDLPHKKHEEKDTKGHTLTTSRFSSSCKFAYHPPPKQATMGE